MPQYLLSVHTGEAQASASMTEEEMGQGFKAIAQPAGLQKRVPPSRCRSRCARSSILDQPEAGATASKRY